MIVEDLTLSQIVSAIAHIESYYMRPGGVDIFEMSTRDPHLYSTWRKLRDRQRKIEKEGKRDERRTNDRR